MGESPSFQSNILWRVIFFFNSYSLCQPYFIFYGVRYFICLDYLETGWEDILKGKRPLELINAFPGFIPVLFFFFDIPVLKKKCLCVWLCQLSVGACGI